MLAKLPRDVSGNLSWITVGMGSFARLKMNLLASLICECSFLNWSAACFLAEPNVPLEKEIDWKIITFTPENVEKGNVL